MARVPKIAPLSSEKMRALPLAPAEGFILSRIDGSVTEAEIAALTGFDEGSVRAALDKLLSLGVVTFGEPPVQPRPEPRPSSLPPQPVTEVSDVEKDGQRKLPRGLYDPGELDEDVEIELEHRRAILDRFYVLGEGDHYALLGVGPKADKKAIKRAYFEAAALFHPDRHFRKRLGSFKAKMEAIFGRITLAHDTLTDPEARAEYDAYLATQAATRQLEEQLALDADAVPRADPKTPPPQPSPVIMPSPPPEAPRTTPTPSSPPSGDQARRDALAMRLRGSRLSSIPPSRASAAPAAPSADPEALRRYHEDRVTSMRERLARQHATTAREAVAKGDWIAAMTAFRLALTVSPNDADLKREHDEAQGKANAILGEQYKKQASYEEKSGDFAAAARTWTRAAKALSVDAHCQDRAAFAILKAGGSLHEARAYAQRAVDLDPKKATYRVTLAEIFLAAGLPLNARRELDTAAQLAPGDGAIEALLKKVAKAK